METLSMPENRLTRLETQTSAMLTEQHELRLQFGSMSRELADQKGDIKVVVEQVKMVRQDVDQLITTLTDTARERDRRAQVAMWQKVALAVGLLTWFASTFITIALAVGWLGTTH